MIPVTHIEAAVLTVIRRWQADYKNSPNSMEIGRELNRSKQSVWGALYRLQKKGYIEIVRVMRRPVIVPLFWE